MTPGLNGRGLLNLHFSNCTVHFGKPNSPGRLHWGNEPTHWMPQSKQIKRKKSKSNCTLQKSWSSKEHWKELRYQRLLTFSSGNTQALDSVVYSLESAFAFCDHTRSFPRLLLRPRPRVSGYFWIRNSSFRIQKFLLPHFIGFVADLFFFHSRERI